MMEFLVSLEPYVELVLLIAMLIMILIGKVDDIIQIKLMQKRNIKYSKYIEQTFKSPLTKVYHLHFLINILALIVGVDWGYVVFSMAVLHLQQTSTLAVLLGYVNVQVIKNKQYDLLKKVNEKEKSFKNSEDIP